MTWLLAKAVHAIGGVNDFDAIPPSKYARILDRPDAQHEAQTEQEIVDEVLAKMDALDS